MIDIAVIETEKELVTALDAYMVSRSRVSPHDLDRDIYPLFSEALTLVFHGAARIDRWRRMLSKPQQFGLKKYISLGKDEYAHQQVLLPEEWESVVRDYIARGVSQFEKARLAAGRCATLTGYRIDVEALIESAG